MPFAAVFAGINPPAERNIYHNLSKKEKRQLIRDFKKNHKSDLKGLSAKEKRAFIADGITKEQLIPNGWLPVGVTLLIIGAIMALFGGVIAWVGGGIAFVGLVFVIIWLVLQINSPY